MYQITFFQTGYKYYLLLRKPTSLFTREYEINPNKIYLSDEGIISYPLGNNSNDITLQLSSGSPVYDLLLNIRAEQNSNIKSLNSLLTS